MRNVNVNIAATLSRLTSGFILTMRSVNIVTGDFTDEQYQGFTLTMRNVNPAKYLDALYSKSVLY